MIPLSVPHIAGNEWTYIKECLDTGWVSSAGKYVDRFENEICRYTGASYAIACVNGTSALHVALQLARVTADDEVIVPTITFIAPVNAVRYLQAHPVFMDSDSFYNIDVAKTIEFIKKETIFRNGFTYNKHTERRIPVLMPVHVFGNAVDLEPLLDLCAERGIQIVEDATESLGTRYIKGRLAGKHCGTVGTVGCLSFNGNKIITTGGGGMILTCNKEFADKAKYLTTQAKDDTVRYIHNEIGYNFRLTNIQAAMGVAQLEQLPKFIEIKQHIYNSYKNKLNNIPGLKIADVPEYATCNHWMIAMLIDKDTYGIDRETLMAKLKNHGIETRPVWYLNHLQQPYKHCQHYKIEKAYELLSKTLNLPCSVNVQTNDINNVLNCFVNG